MCSGLLAITPSIVFFYCLWNILFSSVLCMYSGSCALVCNASVVTDTCTVLVS